MGGRIDAAGHAGHHCEAGLAQFAGYFAGQLAAECRGVAGTDNAERRVSRTSCLPLMQISGGEPSIWCSKAG